MGQKVRVLTFGPKRSKSPSHKEGCGYGVQPKLRHQSPYFFWSSPMGRKSKQSFVVLKIHFLLFLLSHLTKRVLLQGINMFTYPDQKGQTRRYFEIFFVFASSPTKNMCHPSILFCRGNVSVRSFLLISDLLPPWILTV